MRRDLKDRIRRIKDLVSIDVVVTEAGGHVADNSWGEWQKSWCPFHDDSIASAATNLVAGRFVCHACDAKGDVVDLAKLHLGTEDFDEAIEWLEGLLG